MGRSTWLMLALMVATDPCTVRAHGVVPSPPWGSGGSGGSDGGTFVLEGTVARADRPLFVNGLVVGGTSADGGVSSYAVKSVQDAPWYLGPGTQMSLVPSGNDLTANVGAIHLPTTFITQPACNSGQTCRWYADNGSWFGVLPSADVSGCAAGTEGGIKANSSTHRPTYCDGTAAQAMPVEVGGALEIPAYATGSLPAAPGTPSAGHALVALDTTAGCLKQWTGAAWSACL